MRQIRIVWKATLVMLAAGALALQPVAQRTLRQTLTEDKPPRLTVVIVIDQFRADYLTRFKDLYLPAGATEHPGGFRFLMERGAWFTNARYRYNTTVTGVGHATVSTGAPPYIHGIIANTWRDRDTLAKIYCVEPPATRRRGAASSQPRTPIPGPDLLKVTTLGDELKRATNGRSRVVSLALKDRASILLGGHLGDSVIWFDDKTARWTSSAFYLGPEGRLPEFAEEINRDRERKFPFAPQYSAGYVWEPLLQKQNPSAYERTVVFGQKVGQRPAGTPVFQHALPNDETAGRAMVNTPRANQYVLSTAKHAVVKEKLGQSATPDLLTINLSTNDYIGHRYGPYSPEVLDISLWTDRQLADFLQFLQKTIPGGLDEILIAVTADHGVAPVPEEMQAAGFHAGRFPLDGLKDLPALLERRFPAGQKPGDGRANPAAQAPPWQVQSEEFQIYVNQAAIRARGADPSEVQRVIAHAMLYDADGKGRDGLFAAYTRSQIMTGQLPKTEIAEWVQRTYLPERGGEVLLIPDPNWLLGKATPTAGTSHGTPFTYDRHVPLLLRGPGIAAGLYTESVSPEDIAPTLSTLLGIPFPSGCLGHPIGLGSR